MTARLDSAARRHRACVAAELRGQGMSYDDIAMTLGFANRSGAWKAVMRVLDRAERDVASSLVQLLQTDLEMLHERAWPLAMQGDAAAVRTCLEVNRQRWKLLERVISGADRSAG